MTRAVGCESSSSSVYSPSCGESASRTAALCRDYLPPGVVRKQPIEVIGLMRAMKGPGPEMHGADARARAIVGRLCRAARAVDQLPLREPPLHRPASEISAVDHRRASERQRSAGCQALESRGARMPPPLSPLRIRSRVAASLV